MKGDNSIAPNLVLRKEVIEGVEVEMPFFKAAEQFHDLYLCCNLMVIGWCDICHGNFHYQYGGMNGHSEKHSGEGFFKVFRLRSG